MPVCKDCGVVVGVLDINEQGLCKNCASPEAKEEYLRQKELKKEAFEKQLELEKLEEERKLKLLKDPSLKFDMLITTETVIDLPIEKRFGLVFAQRVYGMNVVKDFFSEIRDFIEGRVGNLESAIENANKELVDELKRKAYLKSGNAIIGLKFDYGIQDKGFISVMAVGTVVKIKE